MAVIMIRDLTEEERKLSLPIQYQIFSQILKENKNLKESLLIARTIDGFSSEEDYQNTITSLGKSKITDFDIIFTDWINYGHDKVDYDLDDYFKVFMNVRPHSSKHMAYYPKDINEDELFETIRQEEKELERGTVGLLGSAAFTGLNNDDPYINNLRSSNIVPFGNQQVNITQPNQTTQNYGDEMVPYEFNFTRQQFTSPEEVLNHLMGNGYQDVDPIYQQPCYIDQWGNIVYYNPQSY